MCCGNTSPFLAKLVTHNRCVVGLNGPLMMRNGPTICVMEKQVTFLPKLATYDRCAVVANGHIVIRNGPTIGVWWRYMSIFGQISHPQ